MSGPAPTLIFSVMSYAFYKREFSIKAAYRKPGSHITLIVPAPVSANLISSFQVSKNNFGGRVMKNIFYHATFLFTFFFLRASYSTNTESISIGPESIHTCYINNPDRRPYLDLWYWLRLRFRKRRIQPNIVKEHQA